MQKQHIKPTVSCISCTQIQQFSEYVRNYMLARGDARLALDRHFASKAQAETDGASGSSTTSSASQGTQQQQPSSPLHPAFDGYSVNVSVDVSS